MLPDLADFARELFDPTSYTVLGVVLALSFGLSIGISSVVAWLRPPRSAMRPSSRGLYQVSKQAAGQRPQPQTWRMASLRPALRHVFRRQSQAIVIAERIPAGSELSRLVSRAAPAQRAAVSMRALHARANLRLEATDYAIAELRRDMARLMPPPPPPCAYPAYARPALAA